jgi:RNA polymerase sigma-70 factor (ECF subfamily)
VDEHDQLAERFEEHRAHLRAVAFRMLGSLNEADDAVQEAWLRLSRSDISEVRNLGGWLTTVVARISLDLLRSRSSRREEPLESSFPDGLPGHGWSSGHADARDPEAEALLADSVGPALLVVLDRLAPAERLAFVLHDMFAVPFDDIAPVLGRSPNAAKQLASRARRRVAGAAPETDLARQRTIVDAFLAASRDGDFDALLALLDPGVVLRADRTAVQTGASAEVRGAVAVAGTFSGRARVARPALLSGSVGAVWSQGGRPRVAFDFTIVDGRILEITLVADPDRLRELDPRVLD